MLIGLVVGYFAQRIVIYLDYIAKSLKPKQTSKVVDHDVLQPTRTGQSGSVIDPKTPAQEEAEIQARIRKMNGLG